MLSNTPVVIDASSLLNLAATGVLVEVLDSVSHTRLVCRIVKEECLFIRSADGKQREAIDLQVLIQNAVLSECELREDEEEQFVILAAEIDDGEALCLAIAESRHYPLVTDDKKAKRLATNHNVQAISTSEIVREWAAGKPKDQVSAAIKAIESRARYRPPDEDRNYEWWTQQLE